ncbi:MAG: glycosyltransferase family 4 protein, partial [Acidimicrobiales bacterium]|nr:glycosyltransferase family 4 protein [Acidimicrobiales bacterium]
MTPPAPVDLAVLVNGFPRLSETFVLRELLDLERRGMRLIVFALSDPGEVVHQEALGELQAQVEYVPESVAISRLRVALAHLALGRNAGSDYLTGLAAVVRSPDWTRGAMRRAAVLAQRLVELGSPPLYIQFAHKPGTIGRFAARLGGVRYAMSCHAKDIWSTPPEELGPKLRDAELVLTCTAAGREELERYAGPTPVRLVYHGVDVDAVVARVLAPGPPRVLAVGRLVEKKGHDTLIRAAGLLRDQGVEFALRIAGDGPEWPRLQRLVHELDLAGHVTFLGPLKTAEVQREYASASVFALGCRQLANGDRDGLPNVLLEAMVQGLPIVGTTLAGIAEAVEHERSSLLAAPDDAAALADALRRVLKDPELARELGAIGQATARERFDYRQLLPTVSHELAEAGLIPGRPPARPPREEAMATL